MAKKNVRDDPQKTQVTEKARANESRAEFIRAMPSVVKNTPEGSNCAAKARPLCQKENYVFMSKKQKYEK